jgi:antitoxin CptB
MRELDAVLTAYLEAAYETLDNADKSRFAGLLDLPDPELYAYVVGRSDPDDPDTARIVRGIRYSLHSEP